MGLSWARLVFRRRSCRRPLCIRMLEPHDNLRLARLVAIRFGRPRIRGQMVRGIDHAPIVADDRAQLAQLVDFVLPRDFQGLGGRAVRGSGLLHGGGAGNVGVQRVERVGREGYAGKSVLVCCTAS